MKFCQRGLTVYVELTRRNLQTLLNKLDDPESMRTLSKSSESDFSRRLFVTAVEDEAHYADREPGEVLHAPN